MVQKATQKIYKTKYKFQEAFFPCQMDDDDDDDDARNINAENALQVMNK